MKYGLPYKGSKNKLAKRIVGIFPQRTHLYDVFCGGCAITHAAMLGRKFQQFHINDINWMCPTLFKEVLEGKYDHEDRWISREDFFRLKDTDPYVAFVWSFGNNLRDYIYGKDVEPLKKAIHYAVFYHDYSLAKDMGHDLTFIDEIPDLQQRYLAVKHYFEQNVKCFRMQSLIGGGQNPCSWNISTGTYALQSWGGGKSDSRVSRQAISAERLRKKKVPTCRDGIDGTPEVRLQYRERHRSLPQYGGGKWRTLSPLRLTFRRLRLSLTA